MSPPSLLLRGACLLLGICLIAGVSATSEHGERARYDFYRVYKVTPSTEAELELLKQFEATSDSVIFLDGVHVVSKQTSVVVAPHKVPDFLEIMKNNDVDYILEESNLQTLLENDEVADKNSRAAYGWDAYQTLDATYSWMTGLSKSHANMVTLIEAGKTYQKRSILGLKIGDKSISNKPGIFLEAGIHAREWIAPATATYIINQLLTSTDPIIQQLTKTYDFYIFPHANPDGYVYTHTGDRMWRKTRTPYGLCYGADPNRNWDFHWNEVGASSVACTDTYAGPYAFSEIETKSFSNYLRTLEGKIQLYISFHAYSQYLLYPYGHTGELPSNVNDYRKVFDVATAAINKRYSTKYTGGNIYDAIYPAAGASIDWAYATIGTKMAFCYELRPSSNQAAIGFKLPAEQIVPTGEETLDSIVAMIGEVKNLGYFKK